MCERGRDTTIQFNGKKKQWELREWIPDLKLARDQERGLRAAVENPERKGVLKAPF